jgi:hypothetical protein
MAKEKEFQAHLALKLKKHSYDELCSNADRLRTPVAYVVRDLVDAYNRLCRTGATPRFPLMVVDAPTEGGGQGDTLGAVRTAIRALEAAQVAAALKAQAPGAQESKRA